MIEILEIREKREKQEIGMRKDNRVFIFRDGKDQLGSLHFSHINPHLVKLTLLEISDSASLTHDLILDGLLRTACHSFHTAKIYGVIVEEEKCCEHNLKGLGFTPVAELGDEIASEIEPAFVSGQEQQYCLMKTDMIYKGCCKGV